MRKPKTPSVKVEESGDITVFNGPVTIYQGSDGANQVFSSRTARQIGGGREQPPSVFAPSGFGGYASNGEYSFNPQPQTQAPIDKTNESTLFDPEKRSSSANNPHPTPHQAELLDAVRNSKTFLKKTPPREEKAPAPPENFHEELMDAIRNRSKVNKITTGPKPPIRFGEIITSSDLYPEDYEGLRM